MKADVMQYAVEHTDDDGDSHSMQIQDCNMLEDYQFFAMALAKYPPEAKLIYPALKLNGEADKFTNKLGKLMRDMSGCIFTHGGKLDIRLISPDLRIAMLKELGDVLWYVTACADDLGYDLADVAKHNLYKLYKRKEAGTLQGSGDDR